MDRGVIQVYYGEGHGKSTAAIGNAIRIASEGKSVIIIQFLKGKNENELTFLSRLEPEIKIFRFAKSDECFEALSEEAKQEESMNLRNGFNYGKKVVTTGACDMLILDAFWMKKSVRQQTRFIISHRRNRLTDYAGGGRMKEIHGIEVA